MKTLYQFLWVTFWYDIIDLLSLFNLWLYLKNIFKIMFEFIIVVISANSANFAVDESKVPAVVYFHHWFKNSCYYTNFFLWPTYLLLLEFSSLKKKNLLILFKLDSQVKKNKIKLWSTFLVCYQYFNWFIFV